MMTCFHVAKISVTTALALAVTTFASADSIGVNFACVRSAGTFSTALNAADSTGVVAQAYWNNASTCTGDTSYIASPTSGSLVDSNGNATATAIAWKSNNAWDSYNAAQTNVNKLLMAGYLDLSCGGNTTTVTVSNISYAAYDVYVYVGSDGNDRIGHGWLVSSGGTSSSVYFKTYSNAWTGTTWTGATGTYYSSTASTDANEAQYIVFHNVTGSSFTYYEAGDSSNVGVCAIQIVSAVPEPASTVLMLMGAGGLTAYSVWRRRYSKKDAARSLDGGISTQPPKNGGLRD